MLAVLLLFPASAFAADTGSAAGTQSTISTTVPDSHNIRVEKTHATVAFEDEETQDEEGISDNFTVDRFSEPKIQIEAEKGWKIKSILLNDQDVTDKLEDGYLTLEPVYEDMTLVVETEENTSGGSGDTDKDDDKDKDSDKDNGKDNNKGNGKDQEKPGSGKDIKGQNPESKTPLDKLKQWKAAVTGDQSTMMVYILGMAVAVLAGVIVVRARRRK